MPVPLWYIRERCPEFAYLSPRSQQNWLLLLGAEFYGTRALTATEYAPPTRVPPPTSDHQDRQLIQRVRISVGSHTIVVTLWEANRRAE